MNGLKHLIQCHCMLPQYRNRKIPVFHKFVVFSIVDNEDNVVPKLVDCNNCGAIHKIVELGKSEIAVGREDIKSAMSIEDIEFSLPENVVRILKSYDAFLPTWEETLFAFDNNLWGKDIVLTREEISGVTQGKVLRLLGPPNLVKIESFSRDEFIS